MEMSEREHHIKVLEQFLHDYQAWGEDFELDKAIMYAISSLKTDLKYDLLYEGEDVYTKADMAAMLDKIIAEIRSNSIYVMPQYGRTIREADVLHIIDRYKAEVEPQESRDEK